ncbi:winged helix-turn-helix domain-containing protein, partial [Leptolyngbya sp. CCY15150]|uniref:winged helix-turn-helix domain-containing protein n=1 Tax=Leptolyngbya sp. CCY15150 TaxID=2767772 RepID=UPI001951DA33
LGSPRQAIHHGGVEQTQRNGIKHHQKLGRAQGWVYLRQLGWRLRVPRPQHQDADLDAQDAWKKKLQENVEHLQQTYPDADVEVW